MKFLEFSRSYFQEISEAIRAGISVEVLTGISEKKTLKVFLEKTQTWINAEISGITSKISSRIYEEVPGKFLEEGGIQEKHLRLISGEPLRQTLAEF